MPAAGAGPVVFGAVLAAAAMHAGWNALLKVRLEPFLAMTLITASAGLIGVPFLLAFGLPRAAAWPWLFASLVLHLGYYIALTEAYRRAEMSQIYPIARGGAPLLTALASLLLFTEPVSAPALAGIVLLGSGVIVMSLRGRGSAAIDRSAIAFALLTAAIISGYTLVDGIGARTAGDANAYASTLFVIDGLPLLLFALWRRGAAALVPLLRYGRQGLAGGAMSLASVLDRHLGDDGGADRRGRRPARDERAVLGGDRHRRPEGKIPADPRRGRGAHRGRRAADPLAIAGRLWWRRR